MEKLSPTMHNALDGMAFRINTLGDGRSTIMAKNSKGHAIDSGPTRKALMVRGLITPEEEPKKGFGPIWFVFTEDGKAYVEEHGLGKD